MVRPLSVSVSLEQSGARHIVPEQLVRSAHQRLRFVVRLGVARAKTQ